MNPVTSILDIIKWALHAAASYFDLKRETFYFDAEQKFLKEKDEIRKEIDHLRNQGNIDATDRADALFMSMQEKERSWERVSATYTRNRSRDPNPT